MDELPHVASEFLVFTIGELEVVVVFDLYTVSAKEDPKAIDIVTIQPSQLVQNNHVGMRFLPPKFLAYCPNIQLPTASAYA